MVGELRDDGLLAGNGVACLASTVRMRVDLAGFGGVRFERHAERADGAHGCFSPMRQSRHPLTRLPQGISKGVGL